jgi:hypothetical protein
MSSASAAAGKRPKFPSKKASAKTIAPKNAPAETETPPVSEAPPPAPVVEEAPPPEAPKTKKKMLEVTPASEPTVDPATSVKLHALEERVNELKEKIFRSKARLVLLQEAVMQGTITGARAILVHKNEMSGSFRLEQIQYSLDGAPIFNKQDEDGSKKDALEDEFEIFNGSIVPGAHQISVHLVYRGNGYGVFSYLSQYKFDLKTSHTFTAEEGKQTIVKIVGYEKGGLANELKDRPAVRFDVEVSKELRAPKGPAAAPGK